MRRQCRDDARQLPQQCRMSADKGMDQVGSASQEAYAGGERLQSVDVVSRRGDEMHARVRTTVAFPDSRPQRLLACMIAPPVA